jgi:glycosyltransferase involved in cell wall biosynthesis
VTPVRVLMLLDLLGPASGGAERVAVELAAHLPRDRFSVGVCATRRVEPPWDAMLRERGVPWFALGRRSSVDVLPFGRLARVLRRERVDVLHAHMFGSNVWATVVGRAARVPVVVAHEHSWDYVGQPLRRMLDRRLIGRFADAFVAVSEADRELMVGEERVPAEKVVVMPNPYVPRVGGAGEPLPAGVPLVGIVAQLRPPKGHEVLLDAFARVRADAHLVIAGDGPLRGELEARAADLGIGARTHFLGVRDDVGALLAAFDVAVISSHREGTPLFALECMAARTPLVATAVGGLPGLLGDGAVFVPPRDPAALAATIDRLLADPGERAALAAAAAARLAGFEVEAVAERFGALYEDLLCSRS